MTQTNTTDNTAQVARDLGAEVYDGFEWTGDFTKKRTFSFSKLTARWCAWIDCDDVPVGWDKARDFIEEMEVKNPPVSAVWLSYMYDQHEEVRQLDCRSLRGNALFAPMTAGTGSARSTNTHDFDRSESRHGLCSGWIDAGRASSQHRD